MRKGPTGRDVGQRCVQQAAGIPALSALTLPLLSGLVGLVTDLQESNKQ